MFLLFLLVRRQLVGTSYFDISYLANSSKFMNDEPIGPVASCANFFRSMAWLFILLPFFLSFHQLSRKFVRILSLDIAINLHSNSPLLACAPAVCLLITKGWPTKLTPEEMLSIVEPRQQCVTEPPIC